MNISKIKKYFDLNKPSCLSIEEFNNWHKTTKIARPVVYLMVETIPVHSRNIKNKICYPFFKINSYLHYNLVGKYHIIRTNLSSSTYHETDARILHGMFTLLVDHVELDLACEYVRYFLKPKIKIKNPKWWNSWLGYKRYRSSKYGIEFLYRQLLDVNFDDDIAINEMWELYHWWKFIRPIRPDPYNISGWSKFCRKTEKEHGSLFSFHNNPEKQKESSDILEKLNSIEKKFYDEDERMLVRLIKIRRHLWI